MKYATRGTEVVNRIHSTATEFYKKYGTRAEAVLIHPADRMHLIYEFETNPYWLSDGRYDNLVVLGYSILTSRDIPEGECRVVV